MGIVAPIDEKLSPSAVFSPRIVTACHFGPHGSTIVCDQNLTNSRKKKLTKKYIFFTDFELPISQRVFVEWKRSRYGKHFKIFELFKTF